MGGVKELPLMATTLVSIISFHDPFTDGTLLSTAFKI